MKGVFQYSQLFKTKNLKNNLSLEEKADNVEGSVFKGVLYSGIAGYTSLISYAVLTDKSYNHHESVEFFVLSFIAAPWALGEIAEISGSLAKFGYKTYKKMFKRDNSF